MDETVSVRVPKKELNEIDKLLEYEGSTKAVLLREIVSIGIRNKKLEISLEKFQKNEVSAGKAASIAGISLSDFLDVLKERKINFHYGIDELRDDFEGLIENDK